MDVADRASLIRWRNILLDRWLAARDGERVELLVELMDVEETLKREGSPCSTDETRNQRRLSVKSKRVLTLIN